MFKTKDFTGTFNETILFEQLLPREPTGIARQVSHTLNNCNMYIKNCTVNLCITDDISKYCNHIYLHDYIGKSDYKTDCSYMQYIDLKAPLGNNIYFVILRVSRSTNLSTGNVFISINMCYIRDANTSVRLLQYSYDRCILEVAKGH